MQLALIVMLPFVGALLPALMIRAGRNTCATATGAVTAAALLLLLVQAPRVFAGEVLQYRLEWLPSLGLDVNFFLDGYGLLFAGLILFIGLLIITYARFYLDRDDPMGRFMAYLLLFQGAMVGIVLSDNILLLLIFWELTSLSSFLLIGYWSHLPEGRQGARMALIVTGSGGLALIGGMLLLGQIAGSYDISVIITQGAVIQESPLYIPALLLILGGCFTKSAQFPFHFWLPHAMAAPTPVSAYLHSATMVKAGIFLMGRLWPALAGTDAWFYIVATTGLATMVIAAWIALFKDDLKGLLAYSTVSHLGLVTMLFGIGTPFAAMAGVFHIINHATFKAALFMNAGIIDHEAGTRDVRRLGGLVHLMPISATMAIVAALSMAGIPPFNGFMSKEFMLEAAAHTSWLGRGFDPIVAILATIGALFSVAYSLRYVMHVYLGPKRDDYPQKPHDPPFGMWGPPMLLVALVVLIGLFPNTVVGPLLAVSAAAVIGGELPYYSLSLWHGLTPALFMSIAAVVLGYLLLMRHDGAVALRERFRRPEAKAIFETGVEWVVAACDRATWALQNGSLQRYLAFLTGAAVVAGFSAYLAASGGPGRNPMLPVPITAWGAWLLLAGACGAVVVLHRQRLFTLVLVGVIGVIVSLGFLYLSAPDLALTQISVEVVTVVLLLLALNLLPKTSPVESPPARRVRDGIIAVMAGIGVTGAVYAVLRRDFSSISEFHLANAKTGGGGTNVVNVILVDFRGFDTFGEIIVLGIAALCIVALLDNVMQGASGNRVMNWQVDMARAADRHPLLLVVGTRAMLPFALVVGVYIFLRGHNEPGGGFIAGLVVAIALIAQYMASGFAWTQRRAKLDYHDVIGWGVLVAGMTGIGSWLFGFPFLTSWYEYVTLPVVGTFEVASAIAFDLGVFLCVVGSVMLALARLSRVGRIAEHLEIQEGAMDVDPSRYVVDEPRPGAGGAPVAAQ
jgi:multicomponent K+:H+ antiporter subunit A